MTGLTSIYQPENYDFDDDEYDTSDEHVTGLLEHWFRGEAGHSPRRERQAFGNFVDAMVMLAQCGPGLDLCEICSQENAGKADFQLDASCAQDVSLS